jgi:hypothetical protein
MRGRKAVYLPLKQVIISTPDVSGSEQKSRLMIIRISLKLLLAFPITDYYLKS